MPCAAGVDRLTTKFDQHYYGKYSNTNKTKKIKPKKIQSEFLLFLFFFNFRMVFFSCFISMALWLVFLSTLALSAHADMLFCRPLHDPEYRTIESVIETRAFLGRRMSVSLKDLLE